MMIRHKFMAETWSDDQYSVEERDRRAREALTGRIVSDGPSQDVREDYERQHRAALDELRSSHKRQADKVSGQRAYRE